MKNTQRIFLFLVLTLVVASLGAAKPESIPVQIEDLRNRVIALEQFTQQYQAVTGRVVILNPLSRKVAKIETNTGMFLISAQRMDKIDKGYRLYLQIGNPNAASYADAKLRIFWGSKREEGPAAISYEKWRQSLTGMEYVYSGMLEAGMWTDIAVDLKPAEYSQLQYIECDMEVNTVKLNTPLTNIAK